MSAIIRTIISILKAFHFLSDIRNCIGGRVKEIQNLHRSFTAPRRMQHFPQCMTCDNCKAQTHTQNETKQHNRICLISQIFPAVVLSVLINLPNYSAQPKHGFQPVCFHRVDLHIFAFLVKYYFLNFKLWH